MIPFLAWNWVSAAFMPPAASWLLPPVIGCFSSTITFAPASCAVIAAVIPAAPAPTTTTSTFSAGLFATTPSGSGVNQLRRIASGFRSFGPPGIAISFASKVWQDRQ